MGNGSLIGHVKGRLCGLILVLVSKIVAEDAQVLDFSDFILVDSLERDRVFALFPCLSDFFLLLEQLHELKLIEALSQIRIVPVLDRVVRAPIHLLSNVAPSVPMDHMKLDNEQVFLHRPLALANVWVQVVVPPLPTLLANAAWKAFSNMGPVSGASCSDNLSQDLVLLLGPGALSEMTAVVELKPPCMALDFRLASQKFADAIPAILAKPLDIPNQFLVLAKKKKPDAVRFVFRLLNDRMKRKIAQHSCILTSFEVHWMQYLGCFLRFCWLVTVEPPAKFVVTLLVAAPI